jgi:hypothetical protein
VGKGHYGSQGSRGLGVPTADLMVRSDACAVYRYLSDSLSGTPSVLTHHSLSAENDLQEFPELSLCFSAIPFRIADAHFPRTLCRKAEQCRFVSTISAANGALSGRRIQQFEKSAGRKPQSDLSVRATATVIRLTHRSVRWNPRDPCAGPAWNYFSAKVPVW